MTGFQTKDGHKYYIDKENHLIWDDSEKRPIQYAHLSAMIGAPAVIRTVDGRLYETAVITNYVDKLQYVNVPVQQTDFGNNMTAQGFKTASGTTYYIDSKNKLVWGSCFMQPEKYAAVHFELGKSATIQLEKPVNLTTGQHGNVFQTSPVTKYLDELVPFEDLIPQYGIVTIQTKSGTLYTFSFEKKMVQGGQIKTPVPFVEAHLGSIGSRASFRIPTPQYMKDADPTLGDTVTFHTSVIQDYSIMLPRNQMRTNNIEQEDFDNRDVF